MDARAGHEDGPNSARTRGRRTATSTSSTRTTSAETRRGREGGREVRPPRGTPESPGGHARRTSTRRPLFPLPVREGSGRREEFRRTPRAVGASRHAKAPRPVKTYEPRVAHRRDKDIDDGATTVLEDGSPPSRLLSCGQAIAKRQCTPSEPSPPVAVSWWKALLPRVSPQRLGAVRDKGGTDPCSGVHTLHIRPLSDPRQIKKSLGYATKFVTMKTLRTEIH